MDRLVAFRQVNHELVCLVRRDPPSYTVVIPASIWDALDAPNAAAYSSHFDMRDLSGAEGEASRAQIDALRVGLNVPVADWLGVGFLLDMPGHQYGDQWRGYAVDAAGIMLSPAPDPHLWATRGSLSPGRHTQPRASYNFPYWHHQFSGEDHDGTAIDISLVLQIWRRTLRYRDTPLTLEGQWTPVSGERRSIHGLEQLPAGQLRRHTSRLLGGLPFFQQVAAGGRHNRDGDECRQLIDDVLTAMVREELVPDRSVLASRLGVSEDTFDRYRADAGYGTFQAVMGRYWAIREALTARR